MEGGEGKAYPVSSDRYSLETGENSLHRSTALLETR